MTPAIGRPRGTGHPVPSRQNRREFVCDECGATFTTRLAQRSKQHTFCSSRCAARFRERAAGRRSLTLPCGYCGEPVTRPASRMRENAYCNRAHFLAAHHGRSLAEDAA